MEGSKLFAPMLGVSVVVHLALLLVFGIPEAAAPPDERHILVTLSAPQTPEPPASQPAEPPQEEALPDVAAEPSMPILPAPIETQAEQVIPPMDEAYRIPATDPAEFDAPAVVSQTSGPSPANENIVIAWLERHKRYPRLALSRKLEGEAVLQLRLDAQGAVLEATVIRGSGHALLDKEVLKMVERAAPFPLVAAQGTSDFHIPIDFTIEEQ